MMILKISKNKTFWYQI